MTKNNGDFYSRNLRDAKYFQKVIVIRNPYSNYTKVAKLRTKSHKALHKHVFSNYKYDSIAI